MSASGSALNFPPCMRSWRNLIFFGSLYKNDVDALLESLELTHDADKKVAGYLEGHEKPPWLSARSHKRSGRAVP